MSYQKEAKKILTGFLKDLDKQEKKEFLLLSKKWGVVSNSLQDNILALASKETLSKNQLFQLNQYKQLLVDAKEQTQKFSKLSAEIIKENQLKFATTGIQSTQEIIGLNVKLFNKLPVSAIEKFIGISKEGSPLYDLLIKSYPETVTKLTDTLLKGVALGYNPEKTARLMQVDMNGNLDRALRIARTEQMNIYRESSLMQMNEAGLNEWEWITESDACDYCLEQNGKKFPVDESMETHPNCRCGTLPVV
jgi:SPP1 gp7 family putative phage head morphogenesis protein